jgi:hypothetical protein
MKVAIVTAAAAELVIQCLFIALPSIGIFVRRGKQPCTWIVPTDSFPAIDKCRSAGVEVLF